MPNDDFYEELQCLLERRITAFLAKTVKQVIDDTRREEVARHASLTQRWFGIEPIKLCDVVQKHIDVTVARNGGNISQAARELGVDRRMLQRRSKTKKPKSAKKMKKTRRPGRR